VSTLFLLQAVVPLVLIAWMGLAPPRAAGRRPHRVAVISLSSMSSMMTNTRRRSDGSVRALVMWVVKP
jgi:hypothetical protein